MKALDRNEYLYCGLEKGEYERIEHRIMERNATLVSSVSYGVVALGILFLILNAFLGSENLLAYWILVIGGGVCATIGRLLLKNDYGVLVYCYALILIVFAYGTVLSFQPGNINNPSTSIVVFLALMPLVVNDKPIRMGMVIFLSTIGFLLASYYLKSHAAFETDLMNTITFSVLGFFLYISISNRNVKEIYYGIQAAENERLKEEARLAEMSNKAKSNFLANMSHEIRTPMNAILGMDEMILRESHDTLIRKYASDIKSAGKTLLSIINDILDLSKIESGKMELIPVEYDVASVINDIVNMTLDKADGKDLKYSLKVNPNMPSALRGDEIRIRQIILNITNNAIKYTEKGSVSVDVDFDSESSRLKVKVQDTGMGIRPEDMDKLFDSFQRLDETKNRNIEGTGLGLNITRQLANMMGGDITVKSEYGKGSVFFVEVPQEVVDDTPIGDYAKRLEEFQAQTKEFHTKLLAPKAKVLVVDDNDMNLEVITELMSDTKIKISMALSGAECLERVKKDQFDLIFLDQMMPGMSGTETLNEMQKEKLAEDTPIIALTADAIMGARETYIKEGFTDYLSKPIIYEELEDLLLKYLNPKLLETEEQTQTTDNKNKPMVLVIHEAGEKTDLLKEALKDNYKGVFVKDEESAQKFLSKHHVEFVIRGGQSS